MNAGTPYDIGRDGKPDWTRFNESVLGNRSVEKSLYAYSHLPGINHEPYFYQNVFFGAIREYGPEEGWQVVERSRPKPRRPTQSYSRPTPSTSFPYAAIDSVK